MEIWLVSPENIKIELSTLPQRRGLSEAEGYFGIEEGKALIRCPKKGLVKWFTRARPRPQPPIYQGRGKTSMKGIPIIPVPPETDTVDQGEKSGREECPQKDKKK
jgi:hypothetical protein